jgi:hypothetical protein
MQALGPLGIPLLQLATVFLMKIAYIILAHKNPIQLARLVRRLQDDGTTFVIHFDKRTGESTYRHVVDDLVTVRNVFFADRLACYWGSFNISRATLRCIHFLIDNDIEFDYAVLLSGQDYPIKSQTVIKSFFEKAQPKEFIEAFPLGSPNRWTEHTGDFQALNRIQFWHFRFRSRHLPIRIRRKFPHGFEPHGGSQWWALTRESIEFISSFSRQYPRFISYFKYVLIPDEILLNTIISNSPMRSNIVSQDLTFADWGRPNPPYPAVLSKSDFPSLLQSTKLFARKFDISTDEDILYLLDKFISSQT